ncbi:MAG: nuclear transport factor 2 family protein [Candidatus Rokubacteria bacterium]|nr:nuclear transport factor 2 family protein [Candidatus Rokubacteria bacterium]
MNASDLIQEFAAAFNRQDVAGVLACFTEEAVYRDTFYGRHQGHAGLRDLLNRMQPRRAALLGGHPRHFMWRGSHVVVADALRAAAEWTFSYTVSEAIPRSAGRKIRFSGMSLFELKGGEISSYREYFDSGVAFLQLGLAPESLAKVLGRRLRP